MKIIEIYLEHHQNPPLQKIICSKTDLSNATNVREFDIHYQPVLIKRNFYLFSVHSSNKFYELLADLALTLRIKCCKHDHNGIVFYICFDKMLKIVDI